MRVEGIDFKRCCCCLPLRRGLLLWGYLKLVVTLLAVVTLTPNVLFVIFFLGLNFIAVIMILNLMVLYTDVIFNVLFIVAGHKKNYHLIYVYYIYSICALILYAFTTLFIIGYILLFTQFDNTSLDDLFRTLWMPMSIFFCYTAVHGYITLQVRSLFKKLKDVPTFKYENRAAEAQCQMYPGAGYPLPVDCAAPTAATMHDEKTTA